MLALIRYFRGKANGIAITMIILVSHSETGTIIGAARRNNRAIIGATSQMKLGNAASVAPDPHFSGCERFSRWQEPIFRRVMTHSIGPPTPSPLIRLYSLFSKNPLSIRLIPLGVEKKTNTHSICTIEHRLHSDQGAAIGGGI